MMSTMFPGVAVELFYAVSLIMAAYGVGAIGLKAITRADCMLLPKGEKIAKILHL